MAHCLLPGCGSPYARVIESRVVVEDGAAVKVRVIRCAPMPAGCGRYSASVERCEGVTRRRSVPREYLPVGKIT